MRKWAAVDCVHSYKFLKSCAIPVSHFERKIVLPDVSLHLRTPDMTNKHFLTNFNFMPAIAHCSKEEKYFSRQSAKYTVGKIQSQSATILDFPLCKFEFSKLHCYWRIYSRAQYYRPPSYPCDTFKLSQFVRIQIHFSTRPNSVSNKLSTNLHLHLQRASLGQS